MRSCVHGGVDREIPVDTKIGFHQFYGAGGETVGAAMVRTQSISAVLSSYLRDMGAEPELFELMSMTLPESMFIPTQDELGPLGIVPSTSFHDFRLVPKDGLIVATATNDRNPDLLQRVHEIETMCWKGVPIVNLYAVRPEQGLYPHYADPATTHIDGFSVETEFGTTYYGIEALRLYPETRILATLMVEPAVARALGSGNAWIRVNSYKASGVFMSGKITAKAGGDPAILASFRDCL